MWYKLSLLTGLILLGISIHLLRQSLDFVRRSQPVTGMVISLEETDGAYSPIFSIQTSSGQTITYRHPTATKPSTWKVGEEAFFLYDPLHPESPRMISYFWIFNWTIVCMAIGIPLVIIGAGYLFLHPITQQAV